MMELNHAEQVALFEGLMERNTESSSRSRDAGKERVFPRRDLSAHPERQAAL